MVDREMQVVKYHTAARRQPMLIGKDASGRRLPGGPYTLYQILAVVAVATGMWTTRGVWAAGMTQLAALLLTGAATLGAGFVAGRFDFSGRNPLWILASLVSSCPAMVSTRPGRLAGRALPPAQTGRVRSCAVADPRPVAAKATADPPGPTPPRATEPEGATPAPRLDLPASVQPLVVPAPRLTSLEAFLAAAGKAS